MRNFQEKRGFRHIMQSKPALVLLGIIVLVFSWSIIGLVGKAQETTRNKRIAEDKIAELQKKKFVLSSDIEKLKTDSGLEESIREKFGYAKEGERMIVVLDDTKQNQTTPAAPSGISGFFKRLFE